MNELDFQCIESTRFIDLPDQEFRIVVDTWFIQRNLTTMRRTLYRVPSGEVVAIQDHGTCGDNRLLIEKAFLYHFEGEPELEAIMADAGVLNLRQAGTFDMGMM